MRRKSAGSENSRGGGGYKLYTKPQQHDVVRRFNQELAATVRLVDAALERGGDCVQAAGDVNGNFGRCGVTTSGCSARAGQTLIRTAGRKEVIGAVPRFVYKDVEGVLDAVGAERYGGAADA